MSCLGRADGATAGDGPVAERPPAGPSQEPRKAGLTYWQPMGLRRLTW